MEVDKLEKVNMTIKQADFIIKKLKEDENIK